MLSVYEGMNPKVDIYISSAQAWQQEMEKLREIILDCGLTEEFKWGMPWYTFHKSNVVGIYPFKDYCALGFMKGALLSDAKGILVKPGENSQAMRQIRFTSVGEIVKMQSTVKAYIYEALEVEKAGLKIAFKKDPEPLPEELLKKLDENPALKAAFEALTPGRQRGYILYFSQPKQSKTRESRIDKCTPQILDGQGLHDR